MLGEHLPEFLTGLIDGLGTALININLPKGKKIKHLFKRKHKPQEKSVWENVPDGKGGFKTVETF